MALYLAMLLCAVVLGGVVMRYDLYDREPPAMALLAVALGAGAMWLCGRVQTVILIDMGAIGMHVEIVPAAVAAITEEAAKASIVGLIALCAGRWFNDPLDGLVYGALVGLGAAVAESAAALRLVGAGAWLPGQEPVRLAGHLVMGGIGGFGFGLARIRTKRWLVSLVACVLLATALHFAWDLIANQPVGRGAAATFNKAGAIALMLAGMVIFRGLAARGARLSRSVFVDGNLPVTGGCQAPRTSISR